MGRLVRQQMKVSCPDIATLSILMVYSQKILSLTADVKHVNEGHVGDGRIGDIRKSIIKSNAAIIADNAEPKMRYLKLERID